MGRYLARGPPPRQGQDGTAADGTLEVAVQGARADRGVRCQPLHGPVLIQRPAHPVQQRAQPRAAGALPRDRPLRPRTGWRPGISVAHQPPSAARKHLRHGAEDIAAHVARIAGTAPERR